MVKKLISSLLKKKEDKKDQTDIPDELPPLAEDVVKKIEEKSDEGKAEEKEEKKEVKEEKSDEKEQKEEVKEVFEEKKQAPEKLPSISKEEHKEEKIHESIRQEERKTETKHENKKEVSDIVQKIEELKEDKKEDKFFSNLSWMLKNKGFNKDTLPDDMLNRMRDKWYLKKDNESSIKTKKELEKRVLEKLDKLQILESRWRAEKKFIEENKKILLEKEMEITAKVEELKMVLKELEYYNNVPHEKYFHLENGIKIRNLQELIRMIDIIDDKTFKAHVNGEKNDFSSWVKNVLNEKELAERLSRANSREEMSRVFEEI